MTSPTFDEEGYPTEDTLQDISKWDIHDPAGFLVFLKVCWNHHYGSFRIIKGYKNEWTFRGSPITALRLTTGGWSGNESVLSAFKENYVMWGFLWELSVRGGLVIFDITKVEPALPPEFLQANTTRG